MKRIKEPNNKAQYVVPTVLILAVVAVALGVVLYQKFHTANSAPSPAGSSQVETPANTNSQGNATETNPDKGSTPNATYVPPASNANGITMSPSVSDNKVVVSTQLAGYSGGTCKLTAVNGAKSNSQTANIIYSPSFSTCAGFTVPIDELGNGTWTLTLDVTSGGTTNTKTATYEVK